jgi:hypothetical protein
LLLTLTRFFVCFVTNFLGTSNFGVLRKTVKQFKEFAREKHSAPWISPLSVKTSDTFEDVLRRIV